MKTNKIMNTEILPEVKETYEAPVIEVIEVKVERGFGDYLNEHRENEYSY